MPIVWAKSLWATRVLLTSHVGNYHGFCPMMSLNNLFYKTISLNIWRYGRYRNSPFIGLGNYPLRNWFHISKPAILVYAKFGAVTTFISTLFWVISHTIWLKEDNYFWVFSIILVLFFSTTSFAMAFARQNYQMLGWACYPISIFYTFDQNYLLATIMWYVCSLAGITHIFFAVPIVSCIAFFLSDDLLILVLIPAILQIGVRFLPLLLSGGISNAIGSITKTVGATQKKVRYKRGMNKFSLKTLYFLIHYLFCSLILILGQNTLVFYPFLGCIFLLINERFIRVADEESIFVVICSLFTFAVIAGEPNWLCLIAFYLVVNPMVLFLAIPRSEKSIWSGKISTSVPFDHKILENEVERFFKNVPKNSKIYFAFNDPKGLYDNLFDGYRTIIELPLYVASKNEIHLFPDWWAVAETNYQGAPQCWGRSVKEVKQNCQHWGTEFTIVYQEKSTSLDKQWSQHFEEISDFDWNDHLHLLRDAKLWPKDNFTPKWFLLKAKAH